MHNSNVGFLDLNTNIFQDISTRVKPQSIRELLWCEFAFSSFSLRFLENPPPYIMWK